MNEKAYKVMKLSGISNISIGIVLVVVGIATGALAIVSGVRLIREKKNLTF